jgi:hypothetical protein
MSVFSGVHSMTLVWYGEVMIARLPSLIGTALLIGIGAVIIAILAISRASDLSNVVSGGQLSDTPVPLPTLAPVLADIPFPQQSAEYPSQWPDDLRYPRQFQVVDTTMQRAGRKARQGWAAKLRYKGTPAHASEDLAAFFSERGWRIVERTELEYGGYLLLIARDGSLGSGSIVVGADEQNSGAARVLATVFIAGR